VYWSGNVSPETTARINEAIALAEARSECTCETCGDEGQPYRHDGIYMTRCAAHAKGMSISAGPGRKSEHIVRDVVPDGGFRVARRQYDRDADAFIDVDPPSLGIEEE
jgi:hypothetical protein